MPFGTFQEQFERLVEKPNDKKEQSNKKKLLKLLNEYPDMRCTRSVYGNMYKIGGTKATDVKIFSSKPNFDYKNSTFLSTDDPMVKNTCDSWRFIMKQFPGQCKYEI